MSKYLPTFSLFVCFVIFTNVVLGHDFAVDSNVTYRTGDSYINERCKLDVRYPVTEGTYPVVIWFHGGGLTGGEKYFPEPLLDEKMILVAVNYRLSPHVKVVDCISDAAAAVSWVFKNIEKYHGSNEQILVAGHSAGGYLASMIGLDKRWLASFDLNPDSVIKALFPFSGHTITHFTVRQEMGMVGTQPLIDALAPLTYVRADAPALFLMTGDRELEMLGRYEENAYMWRMMKVVGHKEVHLFEFDGHDHGAMVTPGCHVLLEYMKTLQTKE